MKHLFFSAMIVFLLSSCSTTSHLPFAPKAKINIEHKKNKPIRHHEIKLLKK